MPEFVKKCRLCLKYGIHKLTMYQGDCISMFGQHMELQGVDHDRQEALFIQTETGKPVRMVAFDFVGTPVTFVPSGVSMLGTRPVQYSEGSITYELAHRDWSVCTLQQIADKLLTDKETVSKAMRRIYRDTGQRVLYKQVKPHWEKLHILPDV